MPLSEKMKELSDMLKHVTVIQNVLVSAIKGNDPKRVDEILPENLRTTLARAAGLAQMREKAGDE
jgi:flagellar motor component MotA